jgi:type IV pilus assembly protein PilC
MNTNTQTQPIDDDSNTEEYKSLTAGVVPISEDRNLKSETGNKKIEAKKTEKNQLPKKPVEIFKLEKRDSDKIQTEEKTKNIFDNIKLKIIHFFENHGKVPLAQKIFFVQNLEIILKAGLSLGQALSAIKEQTPNKRLKKILTEVTEKVNKGQTFSDSLKNYQKIFNELFISMVASGEVSGNLEEVLKQLHHQLKREHELVSKVRGAMIYPVIVVTAMVGIGIAMVVFVMPKFMSIFNEFQAKLPLPTRVMLGISNFTQAHGVVVLISAIVIIIAFIKFYNTKKGRRFMHLIYLKAPILSNIVKKINLARFSRTMSSLIKTDIQIVQAFNITARTMGNIFYQEALFEASEKIKKGSNINIILREYPDLFPPVAVQMVAVGEESGSVEEMLSELADFYEEEVDQTMKDLPTIIEPVLMLILGVGVAGMAMAVLMPMYSLSEAI